MSYFKSLQYIEHGLTSDNQITIILFHISFNIG